MEKNYFFIDGSALLAQIRDLQRTERKFRNRKLEPIRAIDYFSEHLEDLGAESYKRAVFYFPEGDKDLNDYIVMPNFKKPGVIRDINFKYCGEKLKGSEAFKKFLEKVPKRWKDRCSKSEKGVDIEICCDAFRLAANANLERLFLLTNDRDYIPLCRALKDFGVNISLLHLSEATNINNNFVKECDTYDIIPKDQLDTMFFPLPQPPASPPATNEKS